MKVKDIKTGRVSDVSDSYGARLFEQGRVKLVPAKKEAPRKAKEAPTIKKAVASDVAEG